MANNIQIVTVTSFTMGVWLITMETVQGNCMWVRFNQGIALVGVAVRECVPPYTLHHLPIHTHMYHYPFPVHLPLHSSTHPLTTHFQTKGATGGIQPAAKRTPCVCSEGVPPWCQHSEGRAGHLQLIVTSCFVTANEDSYINTQYCYLQLFFITSASHECHMTVT